MCFESVEKQEDWGQSRGKPRCLLDMPSTIMSYQMVINTEEILYVLWFSTLTNGKGNHKPLCVLRAWKSRKIKVRAGKSRCLLAMPSTIMTSNQMDGQYCHQLFRKLCHLWFALCDFSYPWYGRGGKVKVRENPGVWLFHLACQHIDGSKGNLFIIKQLSLTAASDQGKQEMLLLDHLDLHSWFAPYWARIQWEYHAAQ